ncbi:Myb-like, SWIRM and MPN domains 1 [Actinomortierella wolfii]|nr:Myb-like, SWIRM and MPN domains 1 [Actinomortierella wolfii]
MKHKSHEAKKRKSVDGRPPHPKRATSKDSRPSTTSADLPSHNTRWSKEEDDRLRYGLEQYGYGSWKLIAAVVGTRNALQVKNHARHWKTSHKIPSELASASEGERLERSRSAATTSADEDDDDAERGKRQRQSRSPRIRWMETNIARGESCEPIQRRQSRAQSMTSESGNEDFTGSEFGATIAPTMASSSYSTSPSHRNTISSMDEDEDIDIDIDIESSEGEAKLLTRTGKDRDHFDRSPKSRSISPFSVSSVTSRSRPSSEYDSDSDTNSTQRRRNQNGTHYTLSSSPGPSDIATATTSSSEFYASTNFNTSSSSINSTYTAHSAPKPSLKESSSVSIQRTLSHDGQEGGLLDKSQASSTKERRTVSFGAVHVAELQPDVNSHDEEELLSEGNGPYQASTKMAVTSIPPSKTASSRLSSAPSPPSPRIGHVQHYSSATHGMSFISSRELSVTRKDDKLNGKVEEEEEEEEEAFLGTTRPASSTQLNQLGSMVSTKKTSRRHTSQGSPFDQITGLNTNHSYVDTSIQALHPMATLYRHSSTANTSDMQTIPVRETIIDKTIITEEEKLIHSEFFCNKASKTPERYQRIRNTILSTWERVRPHYVTKTSVRAGLKDCGDVNAIGRVHSWLESIGAINVGLTANSPGASLARPRNGGNQRKKAQMRMEAGHSSHANQSRGHHLSLGEASGAGGLDHLETLQGPRRRRVRNKHGDWVNEKDLDGRTIDHSTRTKWTSTDEMLLTSHGLTREELEEEYEQQRLAALNARYFAESEALPQAQSWVPRNKRAQHYLRQQHRQHHHHASYDGSMDAGGAGSKYDPFRLVPLHRYGAKYPAPFRVVVSSDAMVVMDFHAHLAHTEVIGLLGGIYNEVAKELRIESVFPCKSLSTGLQCEMDPASEMEAREYFEQLGMVVVGWYHSHPTFEPTPSIRDIENQVNYQDLFRRPQDGIEPFIGVIVSPYDPMNLAMVSKFQFLSISQRVDDRLGCRIPYACDREIVPTQDLSVKLFEQLSGLVKDYRNYEHRVNLSLALRASSGGSGHMDAGSSSEAIITTRLEKLLRSLNTNIYADETTASTFLDKVKELVVRGFQLGLDLMGIPSIKERNETLSSKQPVYHHHQEQLSPSTMPSTQQYRSVDGEGSKEGDEGDIDVLMESGKVSPAGFLQDSHISPTLSAVSQDRKPEGEPDEDVDIEGHSSTDYEMHSAVSSPKN